MSPLVGDVDNKGGYVWCGVAVSIWELSVLSPQFCCEPNTTLKQSFNSKKKNGIKKVMVESV